MKISKQSRHNTVDTAFEYCAR